MAEKNIYQKLMQARIDFSKKKIEPSGYNAHLNFDYLELKDIVPVANNVFQENGLILLTTFNEQGCLGRVVDTDDEKHFLSFEVSYAQADNDSRLKGNSPIQICGQNITYLRRYMYQIVLDIVVRDEVDADADETPVVKPAVTATPKKEVKEEAKEKAKKSTAKVVVSSEKKAPVSAEKRSEIKKDLTAADGKADDLQVKTLNALAMRWVNAVPEDKETATNVMVKTNGFSDMSRKEADELIDFINGRINAKENK